MSKDKKPPVTAALIMSNTVKRPAIANLIENHGDLEARAKALVEHARTDRLATLGPAIPRDWGRAVEAAFPSLWPPYSCEVPDGWIDLILAFSEHAKLSAPTLVVEDAKEKFGGLRLNLSSASMSWDDLDLGEVYENLSLHVCQKCGEPGRLRTDRGWQMTLCEDHDD